MVEMENVLLHLSTLGHTVTTTTGDCAGEGRLLGDNHACWYLAPQRYIFELCTLAPLCTLIGTYCITHWYNQRMSTANHIHMTPPPHSWTTKILLTLVFLLTLQYKMQQRHRNGLPWMLMPCNLNLTMIVASAWSSSPFVRVVLDHGSLALLSLAVGVFVQPDTSNLELPYEVHFFWIQHGLRKCSVVFLGMLHHEEILFDFLFLPSSSFFILHLPSSILRLPSFAAQVVLWPIGCLYTHRISMWSNVAGNASEYLQFGWINVLTAFYMSCVTFLCFYLDLNINYMTHPPPGVGSIFGEQYRLVCVGLLYVSFGVSRIIGIGVECIVRIAMKEKRE